MKLLNIIITISLISSTALSQSAAGKEKAPKIGGGGVDTITAITGVSTKWNTAKTISDSMNRTAVAISSWDANHLPKKTNDSTIINGAFMAMTSADTAIGAADVRNLIGTYRGASSSYTDTLGSSVKVDSFYAASVIDTLAWTGMHYYDKCVVSSIGKTRIDTLNPWPLSVVPDANRVYVTRKYGNEAYQKYCVIRYPGTAPSGSSGSAGGSVATDNFNRPDGTLGSSWTSLYLGGTSVFGIASNQAQAGNATIGVQYSFWIANSFNNNQYSQAKVVTTFNWDRCGVIVRASSGNYYYAYAYHTGGGNAEFGKVVSGTKTIFSSAITTTLSVTDVIKITASGTTISWYINGALKESVTDASLSAGAAGIATENTSGAGIIDDWEGGNL